MLKPDSIFLSIPISSFPDGEDLEKFKDAVFCLLRRLRSSNNKLKVYCALEHMPTSGIYNDPTHGTKSDLAELDSAKVIIFIYPKKTPTSALIELGYAIAKKKKIMCITPSREMLPYMSQCFDSLYDNFELLEADIFNMKTLDLIDSRLSKRGWT